MTHTGLILALAVVAAVLAPPGSDGPQVATCGGVPATIIGTASADVIRGTSGPDVIVGLGGRDTIRGNGGADILCGNGGADHILGGAGQDKIFGGAGSDFIEGGGGGDIIHGGKGNDTVNGGKGHDVINGNAHRDVIRGAAGNDLLLGNGGRDVLVGGSGADQARGGQNRDRCFAEAQAGCESAGRFWLHKDGIGASTFGSPTSTVIAALAGFADPPGSGPDDDSGWMPSVIPMCPGQEARFIEWGNLTATFLRDSVDEEGEFFTWRLHRDAQRDLGLLTRKGLGVGDSVAALQAIYPMSVLVEPSEVGGWLFMTRPWPEGVWGAEMWGGVTGGDPNDVISTLYGGRGCMIF